MTRKWKPRLTPEDREIFMFMTNQRDKEVHLGGAQIEERDHFDPVAMFRFQPLGTRPDFFLRTNLVFGGLGPELANEVRRICNRYLELLDGLIDEFEATRSSGSVST
jgi:hypothetical protein